MIAMRFFLAPVLRMGSRDFHLIAQMEFQVSFSPSILGKNKRPENYTAEIQAVNYFTSFTWFYI